MTPRKQKVLKRLSPTKKKRTMEVRGKQPVAKGTSQHSNAVDLGEEMNQERRDISRALPRSYGI